MHTVEIVTGAVESAFLCVVLFRRRVEMKSFRGRGGRRAVLVLQCLGLGTLRVPFLSRRALSMSPRKAALLGTRARLGGDLGLGSVELRARLSGEGYTNQGSVADPRFSPALSAPPSPRCSPVRRSDGRRSSRSDSWRCWAPWSVLFCYSSCLAGFGIPELFLGARD